MAKLQLKQSHPQDDQPEQPVDKISRGWQQYAQKDYAGAEESFRAALQEQPENPDILYALGLTLKAATKFDAAIDAFTRVIAYLDLVSDPVRARMVKRLAIGQINDIKDGKWNMESQTWQTRA